MSLLTQTFNSLQYQFHKATYDPDADKFAEEKAAADKKAADEAAEKKKADEDAKKAQTESKDANAPPSSDTLCYGTPISLGPTNFFKDEVFDPYIQQVTKEGGPNATGYLFKSLIDAQTAAQKKPNCTGIITFKPNGGPDNGQTVFLIYISATTLTNSPKAGTTAAVVASAWKEIQFIPVIPCADADSNSSDFSWTRLIGRIISITTTIVMIFLLIVAGLYGASLATNLNLYQTLPIRILYALYGFLFFWAVIPYVLLYRWWWKGKRPVFYAFIPIIPYKFDNRYAAIMFSWMSYKPDDAIACLQEWNASQL
jgi:hypothetical protein